MTTQAMRQRASLLAAVGAVLAWSPAATAQLSPEGAAGSGYVELTQPGWVDGRVAEVEAVGPAVTVLRLEDGTRLAVPVGSTAAGSEVRVGAPVSARYVETASGKVAVQLRVEPSVQAP